MVGLEYNSCMLLGRLPNSHISSEFDHAITSEQVALKNFPFGFFLVLIYLINPEKI
jgi:hypothetical protein